MLVEVGHVEAIFRYPVKSMAGEPLEAADLGWHGVEGDRRLVFRRIDDRSGFPWLSASRLPALVLFAPHRSEDDAQGNLPRHVRTPDGEELPVFGKDLATEVERRVGAPVEMMHMKHGIFDDEGRLRIGCDMRRLAEAACTRRATIQNSGLPELFKMGLLRSKRPKGRSSSVFILPNPEPNISRTNKIATHFIGPGYVKPQNALETLRLLARMRSGKDKHAAIDRLGMPAMFVAIALLSGPPLRGYSVEELADVTGRRKYDLRDAKDRPGILSKLKAAGIIREVSGGLYRLTDRFREAYERHLEYSGITHTERTQRRQHEEDRRRRAQKLAEDKQPTPLRGRDQVRRIMERKRKEAGDQGTEERLTDEQRIRIYIAQGMKPSWARAEVLGKGVLGRGASP